MNIREAQDAVRKFHETLGFPVDLLRQKDLGQESGQMARYFETGLFRAHLGQEEQSEFGLAWAQKNVKEMADGLADRLYILLGDAVSLGIDLQPIFEEICRSNATKSRNGDEYHPKGKDYKPPVLEPLLREQRLIE